MDWLLKTLKRLYYRRSEPGVVQSLTCSTGGARIHRPVFANPGFNMHYIKKTAIQQIDALKAGEISLSGLAEDDIGLPKFNVPGDSNKLEFASWQQLGEHWQQSLDELGSEIERGFAAVDPVAYSCSSCDLQAVCRISNSVYGLDDVEGLADDAGEAQS